MALKSFASMEDATGTNWNAAVDDLPDTICHMLSPQGSIFRGTLASLTKLSYLKLRPVQGRYLCIKLEKKQHASTDGDFEFRVAFGGAEVVVFSGTATSGTWTFDSDVIDMENDFAIGGVAVDITGEDVELRLYCDQHINLRLVEIYSGPASVVSDYGG